MKKFILTLSIALASVCSFAQNTYPWPSTGNVGIGTSTPAFPLDIQSTNAAGLRFGRSATDIGQIDFSNNDFNISSNTNNMRFNVPSGQVFSFSTGNVGIGTTSPAAKLQVGDATAQTTVGIFGNSAADKAPALAFVRTNGWYQTMPNTTDFSLGYNIASYSDANILAGSKFYVTSTGNVGIGTTDPDEKLTVKGNIHAAEVIVDPLSAIPDYVFEPEYKLMGLNELKTYVDKNHHLPYIPSAKEIEKDGIKVGDISMNLLKTIEELTLHVIELNNQVKAQNAEIISLKDQLKK